MREMKIRRMFRVPGVILTASLLAGCANMRQLQPRGEGKLDTTGEPPFTFVVIGDTRPGAPADPADSSSVSINYLEQILWINRLRPDLTINVGDFVLGYNTKVPGLLEKQWDAFDSAGKLLKMPYYMAAGNHDIWDEYATKIYTRRYGPLYYSFDHKKCHFTVLCTDVLNEALKIGREQLAWLEKDLALAKDARFRFVFLHAPLFSVGSRYEEKVTSEWMSKVHPLLLKYKVDTVFAGHDHYYEFNEIDGIRCIITGGGGAELHGLRGLGGFYHFLKVEVPAEGRPKITVIERSEEHPQNVIVAGIRPRLDVVRKGINFGTLISGVSKPQTITLTVSNVFDKELLFDSAWKDAKGQPSACTAPPAGKLKLQPGETNSVTFTVSLPDSEANADTCDWSLTLGGTLLVAEKAVVPIIRQGFYTEPSNRAELKVNSISRVVIGADKWKGSQDCSAAVWMTRSGEGLTVTAEVTDDKITTSNGHPWENDSVEMYFDLRPAGQRGIAPYTNGVFQIIIVPKTADTNSGMATFYPDNVKSAVPGAVVKTEVTGGAGYRIEIFLPFEGMRANHFMPGGDFNFSFGVNDADVGRTKCVLMWSGSAQNFKNPSGFGHMTALPKP